MPLTGKSTAVKHGSGELGCGVTLSCGEGPGKVIKLGSGAELGKGVKLGCGA